MKHGSIASILLSVGFNILFTTIDVPLSNLVVLSITAHPLIHKFCGDSYIRLVLLCLFACVYLEAAVATVFEIATFPLTKVLHSRSIKNGFFSF